MKISVSEINREELWCQLRLTFRSDASKPVLLHARRKTKRNDDPEALTVGRIYSFAHGG